MLEIINKLQSTTLQSHPLTHTRLKHIASIAQMTEDHISRIALGLSICEGSIGSSWEPRTLELEKSIDYKIVNEKHLRGRTLFKEDISLWMGLILQNQIPIGYNDWRKIFCLHWERGVEILMKKSLENGDWIRTIHSCLSSSE
mgnify:FL=1